ncbi:MAG: HlyC/CorC family transporter [Acidobacteria bacterium]|nr:HlyC/CorC family transporter [Acidobacteriota bacterium]
MTVVALLVMSLVFVAIAAVLTAADAAFSYFPRHDAESLAVARGRSLHLNRILARPVDHMNALRFWRIWFEMAGAVAVALSFVGLADNVWVAGLLATVLMAGVGFVLVGVSPRQWGRLHSAAVVRGTAWLIRFLCWILGPIPGWLVRLGTAVAPGVAHGEDAFVSEEEFLEFVDRASESEMIEDTEAELIHSVFDLGDTLVRSVMVPRTDMVCVEADSSLEAATVLFLRSGYSRMPVIGENTDEILGILYLKDVVARSRDLAEGEEPPTASQVAREVRYVPESKLVGDLLRELQVESTHVAIVIDEYGGTAGLVTLEDLIEEIVGEIVDEYDSATPEVQGLGERQYRVSARLGIDDLGELFDIDLDDDEVDTAGGLLAKYLGRVPIVGSEVEVSGITLRAERLEGRRNRVSHIIVTGPAPDAADESLNFAHYNGTQSRDSRDDESNHDDDHRRRGTAESES